MFKTGDIIKFKNPANEYEQTATFLVLEDRGPRVAVRDTASLSDNSLIGQAWTVYATDDLELVERTQNLRKGKERKPMSETTKTWTMQSALTPELLLEYWQVPIKPCGLNADWSVRAWHLSNGEPNKQSGDLYLIDTETKNDDGLDLFEVVQCWYDEDSDDNVHTITFPMSLDELAKELTSADFEGTTK